MSHTRLYLNRWRNKSALAFLLLVSTGFAAQEEVETPIIVEDACTPSEKWVLGTLAEDLPIDTQAEFKKFLAGQRQPFAAFAEIVALRSSPSAARVPAFINYWLGRTLFAVGLYSEAGVYFDQLVSIHPKQDGLSIQMAAMACLQRVHELAPQVEYSKKAIANIPAFYEPWLVPKHDLPVLWEATVHFALSALKENKIDVVDDALVLLEGAGPYEWFVQGLLAVERHEMDVAATVLEQLLSNPKLPPSLGKMRNELLLLLASAQYDREDYRGAASHLELVNKKSNNLIQAQALLSSAQFMNDNFVTSIGTATRLKSDAFRSTFAPEAFTTISMGLIEFCRYAEAQSNLDDFRAEYESSYRWLQQQMNNKEGSAQTLYPLAIAVLEGKQTAVPARVASEWLRSPLFISHQTAINSVFASARAVDQLAVGVSAAYKKATEELTEAEASLRETVSQTETHPETKGENALKEAMLRGEAVHAKARFDRLKPAEPLWQAFLSQKRANVAQETTKLGIAIEVHLRKITQRMLTQLDRVVANNEAVEAELLNSASQDMIVQSSGSAASTSRRPSSLRRLATEEARSAEIWEDELGVSEVTVQNNCPKKKSPSGEKIHD